MTFCHECGKSVVPPSAKFCRNYRTLQWEEALQPIISAKTPITESSAEPLSIQGITPPLLQSRNLLLPPDGYNQSQSPESPVDPAAAPKMLMRSNGRYVGSRYRTEIFCGICGTPLQFTSPGLTATQQPDRKTCSNCGKPLRATTKFCGAGGMAAGLK